METYGNQVKNIGKLLCNTCNTCNQFWESKSMAALLRQKLPQSSTAESPTIASQDTQHGTWQMSPGVALQIPSVYGNFGVWDFGASKASNWHDESDELLQASAV
jgi:hypothetical protein